MHDEFLLLYTDDQLSFCLHLQELHHSELRLYSLGETSHLHPVKEKS